MIDVKNLKGILLDSGRVLNSPRTGHWFISPNFYNYVDRNKFEEIDKDLLDRSFKKGMDYLNRYPTILTEDEEYKHFIEFYKIVFNELSALEVNSNNILEVAKDTVFNDEKFYFHEDVLEVIPRLSEKYKLGVVSDTWPSLDRVFRNVGLRNYFSTFVMSSILGVIKPNQLMFTTALNELNLKPEEVIFIDDNIGHVDGAKDLGIQSILMVREDIDIDTNHLVIKSLKDLENLLK